MNVTMKYLAEKSGYSKSTISRALNDDPRVKKETKEEIRNLAAKYHYRPHAIASNLAKRQTKTIGMLFPKAPRTISDPFFMEFFNGVSDTSFNSGYSLLIPQISQGDMLSAVEQLVQYKRVDGLILTEPKVNDPRVRLLQRAKIPFVFLGRTIDKEVSWVDGDNVAGAYEITKFLIREGHRQIAILVGEPGLVAASNRQAGYERALFEFGIPIKEEWKLAADFTRRGGYEAVCTHLESESPVTAFFASNDLMAIGAIQALKEHGIRVPEDVSVAGFDGIEMTTFVDPPLTTVQQPIYHLGQVVTEQLFRLIQGVSAKQKHIVLPVEIVVRGSTGRPAPKKKRKKGVK